MVFYMIGLGLGDEQDVTLKGLAAIRASAAVFLEEYTAILGIDKTRLEALYGCTITTADREMVENAAEHILKRAKDENVAFLVVGDPFAATTHHDLLLRAAENGITVRVIHNASIMNAIGCTGLQLYQFGQTVSIPFFRDTYRPDSFYAKIKDNLSHGFHTLCLLDIKVKEQSPENMAKGIKVYEPPRFMTVNQCIEQLLEVEDKRKETVYSRDTRAFGVARVGQDSQKVVSGTLGELLRIDFGAPLHSVVVAGHMHYIEEEMYAFWHWSDEYKAQRREAQRVEQQAKDEFLLREWQAQKQAEADRKREWEERKKEQKAATVPSSSSATAAASSAQDSSSSNSSNANANDDDDEPEVDLEPF